MIIANEDALKRLNSSKNLINKLRNGISSKKNNSMSLFIRPAPVENKEVEKEETTFNPFPISQPEVISKTEVEIKTEDILDNHDTNIKLGLAHNSALQVLTDSVAMLAQKLDDIKPDKLPAVITATSKVVESIRRERNEANKNNKGGDVHYHFYTPQQKKISDFAVIEVTQ